MSADRPVYWLKLRPLPGPIPDGVRLRRLLKRLLRAYGLEFLGFEENTVSRCKSCGALIRWAKTESGKNIPLNPEPVLGGNIALTPAGEAVVLNTETVEQERAAGRPCYVSHFADCPAAAQHRNR